MSGPLERPLTGKVDRAALRRPLSRAALVLTILGVFAFLVSRVDFRHDLHRLHARVLSGPPEGSYHARVDRLAQAAAKQHGKIDDLESAGSLDNMKRLADGARTCDVEFALAQDGTAWPPGVELVGRFAKSETVLFLGKAGDRVHDFADLRGLRIGAGVVGSGTDAVVRALFALPEFASLGVTISNHGVEEELAMAARGDLDLAVTVIDKDAALIEDWVGHAGLEIASFASAHAVARRLPHLKDGVIAPGTYDAVRGVPKESKSVLKVETVLVANRCAGRVETMDLLAVVAADAPDFVRHNKDTPNTSGLALSPAAADFLANDGPQIADLYVPWLVDVMPPANWAYVVMAVSVLFNVMGAGHRFRLWRIDAERVRLEGELGKLFPPSTTLGDIRRAGPSGDDPDVKARALGAIDALVTDLERLAARSRRHSLSMLVPMGQEMAYRYQEGVIYETLAVLRDYRRRCLGDLSGA